MVTVKVTITVRVIVIKNIQKWSAVDKPADHFVFYKSNILLFCYWHSLQIPRTTNWCAVGITPVSA